MNSSSVYKRAAQSSCRSAIEGCRFVLAGGGRRAGDAAYGARDAAPREAGCGAQRHRWSSRPALLCVREHRASSWGAMCHRHQHRLQKVRQILDPRKKYRQQNITSIISLGIISPWIISQEIISQLNNIAEVIDTVDIYFLKFCYVRNSLNKL